MSPERDLLAVEVGGGLLEEVDGGVCPGEEVPVPVQAQGVLRAAEKLHLEENMPGAKVSDTLNLLERLLAGVVGQYAGVELEEGREGRGARLLGPDHQQLGK